HGVLLSIQGSSNLALSEIYEASSLIQDVVHEEANIIFGTVIDDTLGDEVRVTVIAAGFDSEKPVEKKQNEGIGRRAGNVETLDDVAPIADPLEGSTRRRYVDNESPDEFGEEI